MHAVSPEGLSREAYIEFDAAQMKAAWGRGHRRRFALVDGREAIASTIASFIRPGAPGIERIEFRVVNIAANGPVVMTERVDVFTLPGKSFELQVMGIFEIADGKINAWRDYFDQNQFDSQMGAQPS